MNRPGVFAAALFAAVLAAAETFASAPTPAASAIPSAAPSPGASPNAIERLQQAAQKSRSTRDGLVALGAATVTRGGKCPYPLSDAAPAGSVSIDSARAWSDVAQISLHVWKAVDSNSGACPTDVSLASGDSFRFRIAASHLLFVSISSADGATRVPETRIEEGTAFSFPSEPLDLGAKAETYRVLLWSSGARPAASAVVPEGAAAFGDTFTQVRLGKRGKAVAATITIAPRPAK